MYGLDDAALFDSSFDVYFKDDEEFKLGALSCRVVHLPGHTPDHIGYVFGKAVFTGDSIFNVRLTFSCFFLTCETSTHRCLSSPTSAPREQTFPAATPRTSTTYAFTRLRPNLR